MATKFGLKSPINRLVRQIGRRCFGRLGDFQGWPIQCNHAKYVQPTLVAMATTFALGAESNRLPACLSVCLFVTLFQIDSSSLFLDGIQPFLGHQFSMTKTTKRCSSNFDLLPWQRNLGYFCKNLKLILLFCFSTESSHFGAVSSPWTPLQNVVLRFLI